MSASWLLARGSRWLGTMLSHLDAHPRRSLARAARGCATIALLLTTLLFAGCAQQRYIRLRERHQGPLASSMALLTRKEPKPTPRTAQLLRRYDLFSLQNKNPEIALVKLQQEVEADPDPDKICSYAELSYLEGKRLEGHGKPKDALDAYATSVAHAYWFLLD